MGTAPIAHRDLHSRRQGHKSHLNVGLTFGEALTWREHSATRRIKELKHAIIRKRQSTPFVHRIAVAQNSPPHLAVRLKVGTPAPRT